MKLLSFTRLGKTGFGAVVKDGIIDLTSKLDPEINSIKELISLNMEDEAEEFINSLNSQQFGNIQKFFVTMPKLKHDVKVKNPHTQVESDVTLEGLQSFF